MSAHQRAEHKVSDYPHIDHQQDLAEWQDERYCCALISARAACFRPYSNPRRPAPQYNYNIKYYWDIFNNNLLIISTDIARIVGRHQNNEAERS